jgi:hypothetical protein
MEAPRYGRRQHGVSTNGAQPNSVTSPWLQPWESEAKSKPHHKNLNPNHQQKTPCVT